MYRWRSEHDGIRLARDIPYPPLPPREERACRNGRAEVDILRRTNLREGGAVVPTLSIETYPCGAAILPAGPVFGRPVWRRNLKLSPNRRKYCAIPRRDVGTRPIEAGLPPRQLSEKTAVLRRENSKYIEIENLKFEWRSKHLLPECVFGRLKCRIRPFWESKLLQLFLRRLQRVKSRGD